MADNVSFLEERIIDSAGILGLVMFAEENYGIQVADEGVLPENFDSIENSATYLCQKTASLQIGV